MKSLVKCIVCQDEQKFIFSYQNFLYYRCINCQLVSTYPLPTTIVINKHYAKKFSKGNYSLARKYSEQYKNVYMEFVHILKKRLTPNNKTLIGKKVLDIGCFTGEFLELLHEEKANVYGLELQEDAVNIANKKLNGRVFQADISSYNFPQIKYDIISMLGLIEHVPDPVALIKLSHTLLKKDGLLMIQTPNSSSFLGKAMGKYWPPYSPIEHIHLFSKKSLYATLEKNNFHKISYQMNWKRLPINYIYNNLNSFGPEFHTLLKPFDPILRNMDFVLPFYAGEMIVIAQKK